MLLTNTNDSPESTLVLPDDLLWEDEHSWTPAVAAVSYLLTGALLVETASRQAGRSITLVGPADMAWVTRSTVDTLYEWASDPECRMQLTFADERVFTVAFRHHETAIDAEPVLGFPARSSDDKYRLTLRLMEI